MLRQTLLHLCTYSQKSTATDMFGAWYCDKNSETFSSFVMNFINFIQFLFSSSRSASYVSQLSFDAVVQKMRSFVFLFPMVCLDDILYLFNYQKSFKLVLTITNTEPHQRNILTDSPTQYLKLTRVNVIFEAVFFQQKVWR